MDADVLSIDNYKNCMRSIARKRYQTNYCNKLTWSIAIKFRVASGAIVAVEERIISNATFYFIF